MLNYAFKPTSFATNVPYSISIGDVAGIAVDQKDNVYLFNRSENPIVVLNPMGELLQTWGHGLFKNPHGAHIGFDNCIYLTDNGDHTLRKFTLQGKLLLEIGVPGRTSGFMSGLPFCHCTHSTLTPNETILISDGYGNAAIHEFDQSGKYIRSWGEPGTGPGQFNLPHNICCDQNGWIYVADRENSRIQIFDKNGKYEKQVGNIHRPSGLAITPGNSPDLIIGELAPYLEVNKRFPNLGPFLSIIDHNSKLLFRMNKDGKPGLLPGQFVSPHAIAYDSKGNLYVGDVVETDWEQVFGNTKKPERLRRFQKLRRSGKWPNIKEDKN